MSPVISIRGKVSEGLKESSIFTELSWVKEQLSQILGINPFPGTFNLEIVDHQELQKLKLLKHSSGIEIIPPQPNFCPAKSFPVLIKGQIKGAVIIPEVSDYPENKLEIIASVKIMEALSLKFGENIDVEILST